MGYVQSFQTIDMINTSTPEFNYIYPVIVEALQKHYYSVHHMSKVTVMLQHVLERPFSCTAFLTVTVSGNIHKMVSKTVVHHEVNRSVTESENQAVVEYNILEQLYPVFSGIDKCGVPEPVLVLPEIETYVMKFVDGTILSDLNRSLRYFSNKSDYYRLKEYYFLAGRWLKHFQTSTGIKSSGVESLDGVLERCDQRLQLIESSGHSRCPDDLRTRVMDFMRYTKSCLNGDSISISGRHGDFTPWNILAGNDGINVIDYLGYKNEPLDVDLCKMLVYLEDEKLSITSNKKRVEDLKICFIDGYGGISDRLKPVAVLCEMMQRVVSMWGCICSQKPYFHHKWESDRRFKSHLNWLDNVMH